MSKKKEPVIRVKDVFEGTKTERQAFIGLILHRQQQTELRVNETDDIKNDIINRKKIIDGHSYIRYNDRTPNMRYTQADLDLTESEMERDI